MRICLLTPTFLPKIGGAEICIDQLARNFHNAGHDVVVVTQRPPTALAMKPVDCPYPVERYSRPLSQLGPYLSARRVLARLHQQTPFDILNAHMAHPGGYVGQWFRSRYGVPVVITTHGGAIFLRSRFRSRRVIWQRIRDGLNNADAVISLSSYSDALLREIAPEQQHIVRTGNGVDYAGFADRHIDLSAEQKSLCGPRFILGLGRLVSGKGFDIAIRALAQIANQFPSLRMVFAGEGRERASLEQLAGELNIAERVTFLGIVLGNDKTALLQNCLFTILPSTKEDNLPLVLLESLACGKPVLGSNTGGIPDIVKPDETGLLCTPGSVDEFAKAMTHLGHDDAASRMADHCRQTARQLDWSCIAQRYLQLFQQVTCHTPA